MARARAVLGLIAGAILILSSAGHSILGWKELSGSLTAAHVPTELVLGLQVGWQFGGVAMLALGVILLALFARRWRGEPVSLLPAATVAVAYLGFGAWALLASNFDPFFLVFIVPGVLLALASASRN